MTIRKAQSSLSGVLLQVPGVIVMELESSSSCTADPQWQRIVVAFNASSKEYTGVLPSFSWNSRALCHPEEFLYRAFRPPTKPGPYMRPLTLTLCSQVSDYLDSNVAADNSCT